MSSERLLTPREAAQILAISPRKLWALTRSGEIDVTLVPPRSVRYDPNDLRDFIERCKRHSIPPRAVDQAAQGS